MSVNTSSKCLRQSGRLSKSQPQPTTETTDIKSSLRHMGRKNYIEQDDDSDYCPLPRKKQRSSTINVSERKLSLRSKDVSSKATGSTSKDSGSIEVINLVSPKRKYHRRSTAELCLYESDRKLRNRSNESRCCGAETQSSETKNEPDQPANGSKISRRSNSRRLINPNIHTDVTNHQTEHKATSSKLKPQTSAMDNRRSSTKVKPDVSKPKVIDHFSQSEEINIESSVSNLPKKSSDNKRSNSIVVHTESVSARKRNTLSQKHTENNQQKLNGSTCVSHTNRASISHHGKLCRKTKKTMIYHDSNGWILSKGYWSASCDFWDWSNFDKSGKNLKTQQEIEIPSFREKKYTPLYKIEGTEDLSDHVFEKRHLQYEIMEKKIKKNFVMQSKYELQKSKYLKNNELLYKKESFFVKKFPKFIELNPEVTDVKKIEIVTEVPVMAFGVPVKKMETLEFNNLTQGVTE
ncbi:hypothetical protein M8J76_007787 [Diaphorina citri]|nr:hypothetical protein M8J76_007787 [Diaphorina citri]